MKVNYNRSRRNLNNLKSSLGELSLKKRKRSKSRITEEDKKKYRRKNFQRYKPIEKGSKRNRKEKKQSNSKSRERSSKRGKKDKNSTRNCVKDNRRSKEKSKSCNCSY